MQENKVHSAPLKIMLHCKLHHTRRHPSVSQDNGLCRGSQLCVEHHLVWLISPTLAWQSLPQDLWRPLFSSQPGECRVAPRLFWRPSEQSASCGLDRWQSFPSCLWRCPSSSCHACRCPCSGDTDDRQAVIQWLVHRTGGLLVCDRHPPDERGRAIADVVGLCMVR